MLTSAPYQSSAAAIGTAFDRATPLWQAWTPVKPGEQHALYLSSFDTTDAEYDSAVFLDHLTFGVDQDGASCEEGRTLVTNISADEAQSLTGSTNGYSILIEAVGGSPAPPDPGPVSAPLELDTLAAIGALLAPGFVYVPGSTSGITSAEPAGGADHQLTWLGPFASAPAPNDSVADVRFRVTVPKQPARTTRALP